MSRIFFARRGCPCHGTHHRTTNLIGLDTARHRVGQRYQLGPIGHRVILMLVSKRNIEVRHRAPKARDLRTISCCYKAYSGLGNRSIFYPGSSVGNTITFGIVEDTSSNPSSNISFKTKCLCVPPTISIFPGSPGF